eukprot:COSAG06_NODE_2221_length_7313_cov_6.831577_3_plen_49_part_00
MVLRRSMPCSYVPEAEQLPTYVGGGCSKSSIETMPPVRASLANETHWS